MDALLDFLQDLRRRGLAHGHFLGLLHILIGRKIQTAQGNLASQGMSWRQVAELLRRSRWDRESVREIGLDPDALAPRDRQRFWYQAIQSAQVDSPAAVEAGAKLIALLQQAGYQVF